MERIRPGRSPFLFFDLTNQVVASDSQVVFRGIANPPDQSTESTLRLSFTNTLNLQRVFLPEVRHSKAVSLELSRVRRRRRQEAVSGGTQGVFRPSINADIHRIKPAAWGT